jgi:ABC-2 type transport system ATP-binding protein
VARLLEIEEVVQMNARGVRLNDQLREELAALVQKHGGAIEGLDHPTTTLEDLFLRIVKESKEHPGRRYLPEREKVGAPAS